MRHTLICVILGGFAACSTVSTTEIRYDRELVQYVTVPAEGMPDPEHVQEIDREPGAQDSGALDEVDIRVIPASAPRCSTPDHDN